MLSPPASVAAAAVSMVTVTMTPWYRRRAGACSKWLNCQPATGVSGAKKTAHKCRGCILTPAPHLYRVWFSRRNKTTSVTTEVRRFIYQSAVIRGEVGTQTTFGLWRSPYIYCTGWAKNRTIYKSLYSCIWWRIEWWSRYQNVQLLSGERRFWNVAISFAYVGGNQYYTEKPN